MNKEEMQKAINVILDPVCHECYFPKKSTCQTCLDSNKKVVKKYIQDLESKLNKVTDKLKEDIKTYGNLEERKQMCKEQLYENDGKWFHAKEILNIIEGEKE